MKNNKKTSYKKVNDNKIEKSGNTAQYPSEWLYFNEKKVIPKEIAQVFEDEKTGIAQLWEELGILEIELMNEAKSMDMEETDISLQDEETRQYLESAHIQTVYMVTIRPEDFVQAKDAMERILKNLGGYFCGDTEDFQPEIRI